MLYDSLTLARVATELRSHAVGARIERVFAADREEIVLDLRRKLPRPELLLSWSAEYGRVHLAADAEPRVGLQVPFCEVLRKHLRGAAIMACEQVGFDWVWCHSFSARPETPAAALPGQLDAAEILRRSQLVKTRLGKKSVVTTATDTAGNRTCQG